MNWMAKISLVLIFILTGVLAYNVYLAYAYIGFGQMVYNINTTTPQSSTYTVSTNAFGPQTATVAGAIPSWVKVVAGTARDEAVAGVLGTDNTLRILYWNGATWSSNWTAALGASGGNGRGFDIAVEKLSGDIVVAYTTNLAGTEINFRRWDGATWTAAANYDSARLTNIVRFIKMESKPNSDDIGLIMADTNNDLSAAIWNGTTNAWGNAPAAVLTNDLAYLNLGAVEVESFDLSYESLSGDLLVAYATDAETTGLAYNTYSGGTWSALTRYANMNEAFENVDCASDPLTDNILCAAVGTATQDMRVGVWSGSAWQGSTADVDTSGAPITFLAGRKYLATGWLNAGSTKQGVVVYNDNNANAINWVTVGTDGLFTVQTDNTTATPMPAGGIAYHDIIMDPYNNDRFLFIFQDTTNFDIFAKRLIMDSGGGFTWSDANGGAVITAAPTTAASEAFHFAYDLYYNLNIGNGTDPANMPVGRSSTNNALDSFTMQMTSGSGTVTSLVVTGSANFTSTNIPTNGVKVWRDLGTVGVYDPGVDVQISSASSAIAGNVTTVTISNESTTTTAQNYLVTVDITAGATIGQSFTGTVTSVSGTGIPGVRYQDLSSATLTVTTPNLTIGNGTNPVNKNAQRSSTNNALDGFTMGMTATSSNSTVTSLTVTGSANFTATNIPTNGVKVWRDTGTTVGWWDAGDTQISTASTAISGNATTVTISNEPITMTTQKYLVTVDITAGATPGQSFTATVTAAAGTNLGTPSYADSSSATLTVNKLPSTSTSCGSCHAYPPYDGTRNPVSGSVVGDHQIGGHQVVCSTCHVVPATETSADYNHRNGNIQMQAGTTGISSGYYDKNNNGAYNAGTDDTWLQTNTVTTSVCRNISCHGGNNPTPQWGVGTAGCTECHNGVINSPVAATLDATVTTRRNVVAEFSNTWSHKRSGGGTVTAYDCIVCHMEGDMSTGKGTSSHANGYVDLRDPDLGTAIESVTWNGATPGQYNSSGSQLQFVRFSRNLGSNTLEANATAIQINHCLKCHDADGATNANAQVLGGSALQPFNTTITGHVAPYNSNGQGNVVDVNSSFATANASYHPVRGKQNNSYTQGAMMIAPWNMTKTNGNNTQYGYLISCWDCHAPSGATGVQTSTVTAHGAIATLRGAIRQAGTTAATNLCLNCHATTYATTASQHPTGSAFAAGGSGAMSTTYFNNCSYCHANGPANATGYQTSTARPLRGEDAHGFNDRTAGTPGSVFLTTGSRPYAFFRGSLEQWRPLSAPELGAGNATCTGNSGTCNNNMGNDTYTPGGAY